MKTFSKDQIYGWIKEFQSSENLQDIQDHPEDFNQPFSKIKLLEIKVLIDRHSNVMTDVIVHSSYQETVRKTLGEALTIRPTLALKIAVKELVEEAKKLTGHHPELKETIDTLVKTTSYLNHDVTFEDLGMEDVPEFVDTIWGCLIHYSDEIPVNIGLALALDYKTGLLMESDSDQISDSIVVFSMI